MAQLYVTGPAHFYVGSVSPSGGVLSALYLGTCEREPEPCEIAPEWEPEWNAIGGSKIPFDVSYQGEQAFIGADLNRFNEGVYLALAARPGTGSPPGTNAPGDRGTLLLTEGLAVAVWMVFPFGGGLPGFAGKPVQIGGGLFGGYRFPACYVKGPDKLGRLSTRSRKTFVLFHALSTWNPATMTFTCYDFNLAGLPAIN